MRREARHNGLARIGQVVREAGHFVAVYPGIDEQHASLALHDNGVALAELALVDQHTLRDLRQHDDPARPAGASASDKLLPSGSRTSTWRTPLP